MDQDGKPRDQVGYDALQQEALRGVVRAALKVAAKGMPGDHHFYITFKTNAAGVTLPPELLKQYPDEMRVLLRDQYRDLAPGETFFTITLSFGGQPKSLSIPYAAITEFVDPSVEYRLRFFVPEPTPATAIATTPAAAGASDATDTQADGPNIVSLDQFRKK
ncbi:MAG TPA: ClpXP protease specificity-enhancing factor SspB [Caulobacteraceae bacterium]|jgi:hypothetical protein